MRKALWPRCPLRDHKKEMADILGDARSQPVWVAEAADGKLAGFLEASVRNYADGAGRENVGYLEGWYVRPACRNKGIGKALVRTAEEWARKRGFSHMGSDTWLRNRGSHRAHLAMGYREVGRDIHYVKKLGPRPSRGSQKNENSNKER
jgi:aminoglycoside 6'-N-acetyltransferase I